MADSPLHIGYVIGTYPLLTTRFIDREVRILREQGTQLDIISLKAPHGELSADQEVLRDGVEYVLPIGVIRLLSALGRQMPKAAFWTSLFWLITRPHPTMRARLRTILHFVEGVLATDMLAGRNLDRVHAHFVDRAAVVAIVVSRLLRIPYSLTGHANDIYVNPVLLPEKLAGADFVATCTEYNRNHLVAEFGAVAEEKVALAHHGIEIGRYDPARRVPADPAVVLSIGQLKPKKGFSDLLDACRVLVDEGQSFHCVIVGEGPLRNDLEHQIAALGIGNVVTLLGALAHDDVVAVFESASMFVLPCVIAPDGDRDGIPNVILEAMAMGLPVVSTSHSGIPEAVEDGKTGVLVEPGDVGALAKAIGLMLASPTRARDLGQAGRKAVEEKFDVAVNVARLAKLFRL